RSDDGPAAILVLGAHVVLGLLLAPWGVWWLWRAGRRGHRTLSPGYFARARVPARSVGDPSLPGPGEPRISATSKPGGDGASALRPAAPGRTVRRYTPL